MRNAVATPNSLPSAPNCCWWSSSAGALRRSTSPSWPAVVESRLDLPPNATRTASPAPPLNGRCSGHPGLLLEDHHRERVVGQQSGTPAATSLSISAVGQPGTAGRSRNGDVHDGAGSASTAVALAWESGPLIASVPVLSVWPATVTDVAPAASICATAAPSVSWASGREPTGRCRTARRRTAAGSPRLRCGRWR